MRQIYNVESPPSNSTNEISSFDQLPLCSENAATNDTPGQISNNVTHNNPTGQTELLQCIATSCSNASRLSLANLLPSRFDTLLS